MKITAVAVGTRGDVNPLVELGQEMVKQGHEFRILTVEKFRPLIEGKGVTYLHLDGDGDHIMQYLVTDYKTGLDFLIGLIKLKKENPAFMEQTLDAIRGSDLVMYGTCSGFARHAADLLGIRCVRYFYSPYDRTELYSLYSKEHGTPAVAKSYNNISDGMKMVTGLLMNKWRKQNGLAKVTDFDYYLTQNGKRVLTLYPVSPILMPMDPAWDRYIQVTGYWYHPEADACGYQEPAELSAFLDNGEKPIFIGFGKAESKELAQLQRLMLEVVKELGIKAIFQGDQIPAEQKHNTDKLYFIDNIPYSYIFPRVRAVVHHGGCTTNGLGIWAGCPTLIIPLALDQYYYGRTMQEIGMGPAPLYIRKRLCTREELRQAVLNLVSGKYDERAKELSIQIKKENGIEKAIKMLTENVSITDGHGRQEGGTCDRTGI